MKNLKIILKAILAGILIGIAGNVYLSLYNTNYILGAFLFSFALVVIVSLEYNLYTGKVGYLIENKITYLIDLLLIILGNFIGIFFIVLTIFVANHNDVFIIANDLVIKKLEYSPYQVLALSILCGMLMYLAVEGFRRIENVIAKLVVVIMAVVIFILSGLEHSIANIFYFLLAKSFSFKTLFYFIIMLIGNGIGANLLNFLEIKAKLK